MMIIPVKATPSQVLHATLAGQVCRINVYQKSTGMYADVYVLDVPIVTGMVCRDRVNLIRQNYLGFIGGLVFCDTQGVDDPTYDGLGTRFLFGYLEASDL